MKPKVKHVAALAGTMFAPAVNPGSLVALGEEIGGYFSLPFVPKHAFSISGDWTFAKTDRNEFSPHGSYAFQSGVYTSSGSGPLVVGRDFYRNDAVKNVDVRITWAHRTDAGQDVRFSIFADNLLDNRRRDFVIAVGGTMLSSYSASIVPYNEPRTIGGEIKVVF